MSGVTSEGRHAATSRRLGTGKGTRTQFAWLFSGRVGAAALQALTLALLARWSTPSDFGLAASLLALATVLQTATDAGLPTFVLRSRALDRHDGRVTAALHLNDRIAAVVAVSTGLGIAAFGATLNSALLPLLPLAIWIAAERNSETWLGVSVADSRASQSTFSLVFRRTAALGLFAGGHALGAAPLLAFACAYGVSGLAGSVLARRVVRPHLPPVLRLRIRDLLALSWPYWLNSAASQARNLDVSLIGLTAGSTQAAFYAVPTRLTSPLLLLPTSLSVALMPVAARAGAAGSAGLRRILQLVLLVCAFMGLLYALLALAAPRIVPLVLGAKYDDAVHPLQILCLGLVFAAAAAMLNGVLQAVGLARKAARISVCTTLAFLPAVAVMARLEGAPGAAAALATSYLLQCLFLLNQLRVWHIVQSPVD